MPTSAERLGAIERETLELERLCLEADRALAEADWNAFSSTLRDARRSRHSLVNALNLPDPEPDPQREGWLRERVRRVFERREMQLEHLRTWHADVAARLNVLSRWKIAARSSVVKPPPRRGTAFESLQ